MSKFVKYLQGPKGNFRVDKQRSMGIPGGLWSVEEVIVGPSIDSTHVGAFKTVEEAMVCAQAMAGLKQLRSPEPKRPVTDRRRLVAHTRSQS